MRQLMNHDHFNEICTVETPSQILNNSMATSCCVCTSKGSANHPLSSQKDAMMDPFRNCESCSNNWKYYETRVASEYHSIHVGTGTKDDDDDDDEVNGLDSSVSGGMQVENRRILQGTSSKNSRISTRSHGGGGRKGHSQFCVAHSYLPLPSLGGEKESQYYLEVFATVSPLMNLESGIIASSDMDQTPTSSSIPSQNVVVKNTTTMPDPSRTENQIIGSSSLPSVEGSKVGAGHGAIPMSHHQSVEQDAKQNNMEGVQRPTSDRDCHILIQGYLPLHILDRDDHVHAMGQESERHNLSSHNNARISQIIPISYYPSAIELCNTVVGHTTSQKDHDHDSILAGCYVLFVANGNEVKVYTLQPSDKFAMQDNINHTYTEDWFHIIPSSIVQSKTFSNHNIPGSHYDVFQSCLSQSHTPEPFESLLTIPCPITAMSTFVHWNHYKMEDTLLGLAMGGHDGTVRIVTFHFVVTTDNFYHDNSKAKDVPLELQVANTSQYIVDGPIASLSFQCSSLMTCSNIANRMILYAGSICGFACSFSQSVENPTYFDKPILVVDGLWNPKLDDDDAVLSMCEFQYGGVESSKAIAIGTFSGRLLLFAPKGQGYYSASCDMDDEGHEDDNVQQQELYCFWHCTLPYPVHSIHVHSNGLLPELIVFTRRSIHLFRCNLDTIADSTLERIDRVLCHFKNQEIKSPIISTL